MEVLEAVSTRRSIRKYENRPVEKKKLLRVLEAARLAPSAKNHQPWSFIVITDVAVKNKLRSAHVSEWFVSAPIIVVACALPETAWVREDGEEFWKVDVSIALQNLVLLAWSEGLGTCWVGTFDEKAVKQALGIPRKVRVLAMTPLGYPAEFKEPVENRKPLEEIVFFNHWLSSR